MIRWGKTEVKKVIEALDREWDSAEDAADALLATALEILEARGKFTVVGQLRYSPPLGGYLDGDDADRSKVCLGLYSSRAEAKKAAESLTYSAMTHESFNVWVLDVEHDTPAGIYKKRKAAHEKRAAEADAVKREEMEAIVRARDMEAQLRAWDSQEDAA